MLGRILGGIATSLLFSAFESWLVAEHNKDAQKIVSRDPHLSSNFSLSSYCHFVFLVLFCCLPLILSDLAMKDLNRQAVVLSLSSVFGCRGFDQQWLSITFSQYFSAMVSLLLCPGLFGNLLVDTMSLGPVSPFDATACFLAIGMAVIPSSWGENYGDPSENKDLLTQFNGAAVALLQR
ncbi:unnamed protein product [Ilex paraguariensis]|uniref:Uncharacterized protein n=1 Tax=Ilex paraguariensis TaxID=185542 RepID=A0ABC8SY40_9AQUA